MITCPSCGETQPLGSRFCSNCGSMLVSAAPGLSSLGAGERRQLTSVFIDLVGSTELVMRIDPEELIEMMKSYRAAVTTAVDQQRGWVVRFIGDGALALFGYPVADEDSPMLAVRAGLDAIAAVGSLEWTGRDGSFRPAVRVGVATGMVVVAPGANTVRIEDNLIGSAINLAARLQTVAQPNELAVSEATRRLLGDNYVYRSLGQQTLKGFDAPQAVFAIAGSGGGATRLERRLSTLRTKLVNRRSELATLHAAWRRAVDGETQVVVIEADPGMGKSRLAAAMAAEIEDRQHLRLLLQCSPMLANTALHPYIDELQRSCRVSVGDDSPTRLRKLKGFLNHREIDDSESLALLGGLLSITPTDLPLLELSAQRQKQRTFAVLIELLVRATRRGPVLLLYEDLHWLDPTSRELLDQLVAQVRDARLMVLATTRLEPVPPWNDLPYVVHMPLARLSQTDSSEMVADIASQVRLATTDVLRIVRKSDGVPLFLEEMTRMVLEQGGAASDHELPDTLQGLLTARLDRLGSAKLLAQIGSVIGREFSIDVAAAAAGTTNDALRDQVSTLLGSGLIEHTAKPDCFRFKHALIQDSAYLSLLVRHRRELHAGIASTIVRHFPEAAENEPELVARHLTSAQRGLEAADWWFRAGRQAIGRGASIEAASHLESGVVALTDLPHDEARMRAELMLLSALGPVQMVMKGPGSVDFGRIQLRALQTARRLGGVPRQFPITYGLALFHWGRAEFASAQTLAAQLMATARTDPIPEYVMAANNMMAMIRFHCGNAAASKALLTESTELHQPEIHRELYPDYMMDFGVFGRFYRALSCFVLGEVVEAETTAREATEIAATLGQPHSRGFAMLANFLLATFRRDPEVARVWAEECIDFSDKQGFPEFIALARICRGWAVAETGNWDAGLLDIEEGFTLWKATGFETWQSWLGIMRADILITQNRTDEALTELDEQARRIGLNGENQFRSLLVSARTRALASKDSASPDQIEAMHREAIAIAVAQHAVSWELRATLAYSGWLRAQRRAGEIRAALAPVLQRLPDAAMTEDMKDAQRLMEAA
jgi:class 3 adenylate cyclase